VAEAQKLVGTWGMPYATMFMDKTALDETSPGYIGMYDGRIMNPEVREFVESPGRGSEPRRPVERFQHRRLHRPHRAQQEH
jgi:hypothetical protein